MEDTREMGWGGGGKWGRTCLMWTPPPLSRYALGQFAAGYIDLKRRSALPIMFATSAITTMLCGASSSVLLSAVVSALCPRPPPVSPVWSHPSNPPASPSMHFKCLPVRVRVH